MSVLLNVMALDDCNVLVVGVPDLDGYEAAFPADFQARYIAVMTAFVDMQVEIASRIGEVIDAVEKAELRARLLAGCGCPTEVAR